MGLVEIDLGKLKEDLSKNQNFNTHYLKLKVYYDRQRQRLNGNKKFFDKNGNKKKKFKSLKRK